MHSLKMYIRWCYLYWLARRWLHAGDPDAIAAYAMFNLNRKARRSRHHPRQRYIYALKNRLVEHFYRAGFCVSMSMQEQILTCHDCGGTGDYYSTGDCYRCEGTGIYARHLLYRFVFDVRGTRYIWHQPKRLVTWPVEPTDLVGVYDERRVPLSALPRRRDTELYYITLYVYLEQRSLLQGIPEHELIRHTLRDALRSDIRHWWQNTRYYKWYHFRARPRFQQLRNAICRWWRTGRFELNENTADGFVEENEIPF